MEDRDVSLKWKKTCASCCEFFENFCCLHDMAISRNHPVCVEYHMEKWVWKELRKSFTFEQIENMVNEPETEKMTYGG